MFAKIVALFALIAVAFAAPKPEPSPQLLAYNGVDYISPYGAAFNTYPSVVSPYSALTYPAYSPYAAGAYYVKK